MTQSFVRLAILVDGSHDFLCGSTCRFGTESGGCELFVAGRAWSAPRSAWHRCAPCKEATAQQALDDAVLGAAEKWATEDIDYVTTPGDQALVRAILARRSATREGGT